MSGNELTKRAKAALDGVTEGPWEVVWETEEVEYGGGAQYAYAIYGPADLSTLECDWLSEDYKERYGHQITEIVGLSDADAEFIAGARQLVPDLVAALEQARSYKSLPLDMVWQDYYSPDDVIRIRRPLDDQIEQLRAALAAMVDPDDCSFDHHGDCQAHGFFDGPCGHAVAKELLARKAADR